MLIKYCFTVENTDFPNMRLCGKIFVVCLLEVFNSEEIQGIFTCFRRVLTVSNRVQFVEHSIGTDVIESIYLQNIRCLYNVRIRYLFTYTRKLNIGKYWDSVYSTLDILYVYFFLACSTVKKVFKTYCIRIIWNYGALNLIIFKQNFLENILKINQLFLKLTNICFILLHVASFCVYNAHIQIVLLNSWILDSVFSIWSAGENLRGMTTCP